MCVLAATAAAARAAAPAPPPVAAGIQAFYILFSHQITSSDWPEKLCQNAGHGPQGDECVSPRLYKDGVFIRCAPAAPFRLSGTPLTAPRSRCAFLFSSPQNITKKLLQKVKTDVPGSKVVAYWDFGGMPLLPADPAECPFCHGHIMGDRAGRNCSTTYQCGPSPFLTALQAAFPKELATHDITDGLPGVMVETYPGLAHYVWNNRSAPRNRPASHRQCHLPPTASSSFRLRVPATRRREPDE